MEDFTQYYATIFCQIILPSASPKYASWKYIKDLKILDKFDLILVKEISLYSRRNFFVL